MGLLAPAQALECVLDLADARPRDYIATGTINSSK